MVRAQVKKISYLVVDKKRVKEVLKAYITIIEKPG
jgi:hypothetical protein